MMNRSIAFRADFFKLNLLSVTIQPATLRVRGVTRASFNRTEVQLQFDEGEI